MSGVAKRTMKSRSCQKGLSFMEAMTSLAVVLIISGVAYVGYIRHYDVTGQLAALKHLGLDILHKMQGCVEMSVAQTGTENFNPVPVNNWDGCDSKLKLNLQNCEDCSEPRITQNKMICMEITTDKYKQCVAYRLLDTATGKPFKTTVNHRVCVKQAGGSSVWPYKPCKTNSDCAAGQTCPTKRRGECTTSISQGGCA